MSIVKAKLSDLQVVMQITSKTISEVYPHYYSKGAVEFFLELHNNDRIANDINLQYVYLCINSEQNIVGTITIRNNNIYRLFVLPQYQGKGYGREMLDFAEDSIFNNYSTIKVDASLPAKSIYQKRGYMETEFNKIKVNYNDFLCYDVMTKTK